METLFPLDRLQARLAVTRIKKRVGLE